MTDANQDNDVKINPIAAAALAGVAVGAGIVAAGVAAMNDKDTKEKLEEIKTNIGEKVIDTKEKVENAVEAAKDALASE